MTLSKLPPREGFPLDTRPPKRDEIAFIMAVKWHGEATVSNAIETKHRGRVSEEAIREDINEYDCKYVPRIADPVYEAVLEAVRKEFVPPEPITPWTTGAVASSEGIPKDKSPGLPYILRGFKSKKEVCENEEEMKLIRKKWILIGKGYTQHLEDTAIFYRAQICDKDENKIRAVWGYPFEVFVEEARYVYPYLEWIKNRKDDYPLAYGVEMATGGMGYIHDAHTKFEPKFVTMMDWKKFDKRVPAWLLRDAFNIMREAFDFSNVKASDDEVFPVNPEITKRRWTKMVNYFINTPFRLSNGERFQKSGGVPSGSGFTNIIDSIVNAIITRVLFYHTTGSLPIFDLYMGDDSIIMTNENPSLERISEVASEYFGMIVNLDKSYVTENPRNIQFLGYYCESGYPIRSEDFLIASWIYPERLNDPDPVFTAVRALGQMWSTMNGFQARRWFDAINDIVATYDLETTWLEHHLAQFPNRLKYLKLHGIQKCDIYLPTLDSRGSIMDVYPPTKPQFRTARRRNVDIKQLYLDAQEYKEKNK